MATAAKQSRILPGERTSARELIVRRFAAMRNEVLAKYPSFEVDTREQSVQAAAKNIGVTALIEQRDKLRKQEESISDGIAVIDEQISKKIKRYKSKAKHRHSDVDEIIDDLSGRLLGGIQLKTPAGRALAKIEDQQTRALGAVLCVVTRQELLSLLKLVNEGNFK